RRELIDHHTAAVRLAHVFGLEYQTARRLGLLDAKPCRSHDVAARGALASHRHQRAHPSFVSRAPRLDALPQPRFFLRELLVELFLQSRLVGEPLVLLADECLIVARPRRDATAIDLDNPRRESLEKGTIMGHERNRALIVGKKLLEPRDRVDVEMIRW